jgi:hypothetical protein
MLPSYEACPICQTDLKHRPMLNKPCPLIEKDKLSFVESVCNSKPENTHHLYFQLTSLYKEMMCEIITFPTRGFVVEVNYVLHCSRITFWNKAKYDDTLGIWTEAIPDVVELDNKLITLDYPSLDKMIRKVTNLASFL